MGPSLRPTQRSAGERTYVLTASYSHAVVHAMELAYAALLLRIEAEFGTELFLLGVLANVGAFAFGLGALPAGFLVDRFGSMRILHFTLATSAVASVLVALSPSEVFLGITLAILGLSSGLYHPAGFAILARTRRPGRNVGLHGVIGNLGIAAAPALLTGIALASDWRAAYIVLGALAFLGFLYAVRLKEPAPSPVPALPPRDLPQAPPASLSRASGIRPWLPLILIYVAYMVSGFVYRGAVTFLPTHIEEQITGSILGIDGAGLAGALTTLALLGGTIGWWFGGLAAERLPRRPFILASWVVVVPVLFLMADASGALLVFATFIFVVASFAMAPAIVTLVADYSPPGHLGASFGMTFFAGFGVGSFAATLAGFAADQWGTGAVYTTMALVSAGGVLLAVLLLLISRSQPTASPSPA